MKTDLVADIKNRMDKKTTEKLQHIYDERNEAEWSEDALEAVRQLLAERAVSGHHPTPAAPVSSASRLSERASRRYRDGYLVARAIDGVGSVIKVVGFLCAAVVFVLGLVIGSNSHNNAFIGGGLVVAIIVAVPFWALGVLVSAQGQLLKASLDEAVHTSPFLDNSQRAQAMSLQ